MSQHTWSFHQLIPFPSSCVSAVCAFSLSIDGKAEMVLNWVFLDLASLYGGQKTMPLQEEPFTRRFFIKPPAEPHEPWTCCSSFWEPKAWWATVRARSDPAPVPHLGSICQRW